MRRLPLCSLLACLVFAAVSFASAGQLFEESRVLAVVTKMEAAFEKVNDYTCEVEQTFYRGGIEEQRYLFKYFFKKEKRIRVDFYSPYPTLSFIYDGGLEVTALPFRSFGLLKFRFSVDNPKIQTLAGQKINQTDMGYFIEFLSENLKKVAQRDADFEEDRDQVRFWFQALDYVRGKDVERYRISISRENWLPLRIERRTLGGELIELSLIRNYAINTHLEDKLFIP